MKKSEIVLAAVIIFMVAGSSIAAVIGWGRYFILSARVAMAEDQTRYFVEVLDDVQTRTAPEDIQRGSNAVTNYYHTGTKQPIGSNLDIIVERTRQLVLERIELERRNRVSPGKP